MAKLQLQAPLKGNSFSKPSPVQHAGAFRLPPQGPQMDRSNSPAAAPPVSGGYNFARVPIAPPSPALDGSIVHKSPDAMPQRIADARKPAAKEAVSSLQGVKADHAAGSIPSVQPAQTHPPGSEAAAQSQRAVEVQKAPEPKKEDKPAKKDIAKEIRERDHNKQGISVVMYMEPVESVDYVRFHQKTYAELLKYGNGMIEEKPSYKAVGIAFREAFEKNLEAERMKIMAEPGQKPESIEKPPPSRFKPTIVTDNTLRTLKGVALEFFNKHGYVLTIKKAGSAVEIEPASPRAASPKKLERLEKLKKLDTPENIEKLSEKVATKEKPAKELVDAYCKSLFCNDGVFADEGGRFARARRSVAISSEEGGEEKLSEGKAMPFHRENNKELTHPLKWIAAVSRTVGSYQTPAPSQAPATSPAPAAAQPVTAAVHPPSTRIASKQFPPLRTLLPPPAPDPHAAIAAPASAPSVTPHNIKELSFFTHGDPFTLHIGDDSKDAGKLAGDLVAYTIQAGLRVQLYACLTAKFPGGYANKLAEGFARRGTTGRVFGHVTYGSALSNAQGRSFDFEDADTIKSAMAEHKEAPDREWLKKVLPPPVELRQGKTITIF